MRCDTACNHELMLGYRLTRRFVNDASLRGVCAQDKNMTAGEAPPGGGILPGQAYVASKRMLTMAGVRFRQYKPRRPICI